MQISDRPGSVWRPGLRRVEGRSHATTPRTLAVPHGQLRARRVRRGADAGPLADEVTVTPDPPSATYLDGRSTVSATTTRRRPRPAGAGSSRRIQLEYRSASCRLAAALEWLLGQRAGVHQAVRPQPPGHHADPLHAGFEPAAATTTLLRKRLTRSTYHDRENAAEFFVDPSRRADDHCRWYLRPKGEITWINAAVESGSVAQAGADHDGAEVIARLFNHDHVILTESAPMSFEVQTCRAGARPGRPMLPLDTATGPVVDPDRSPKPTGHARGRGGR